MAKTEAQMRATTKYDKKTYDNIFLTLRKDSEINGNFVRRYADSRGISVSTLIKKAIVEAIERDSQK